MRGQPAGDGGGSSNSRRFSPTTNVCKSSPHDSRGAQFFARMRESLPRLQSVECLIYEDTGADAAIDFQSSKHTSFQHHKIHERKTNVPTFFSQLIDFISSRDFSLEDLGIDTIKLIDKKYNRRLNKQEDDDLPEELSMNRLKLCVYCTSICPFPDHVDRELRAQFDRKRQFQRHQRRSGSHVQHPRGESPSS